ncbi:HNH endonuclease family protein [Parasphingorhabdus sp.]|uniref:HNH endonuclease family protein n=1 Tax=Parasphingorhabdus sp. TaxID=2709688 RepID=UPI003A95A44B
MTRERELYKKMKANITDSGQAVKFSEDMRNGARYYGAALNEKAEFWKDYSDTDKGNLKRLLKLKLEQNRPLLIAVFQHFPKTEIQKAIPALVSWSVRGLIAGVMGKGAAEKAFCESACKVRSGEIKTTADLAVSISSLVPRDSAFESSFSFYTTTNNGFARYLLLAIERHLQGEKQPENVPNDNPAEINLEHILPRRAKPNDWPKFKPDEVSSHSVRLGNMTLLKEAKNNAIGNKPFSAKKPVLCTSNYKLNEQFKTQQDWIKDDIETRQLVLAQYAPLVWKL